MTAGTFIAVEWGTVRLSARLLGTDGRIHDEHREDIRLADLDRGGMARRLAELRARWPEAAPELWLAGMIGSQIGWELVPQHPCPATPKAIVRGARVVRIGEVPALILPGLSCTSRFDDHDVLRGEEVAAAGLLQEIGSDALLLSVPGQHGKWIELTDGAVARFHTSMTVELHRVLAQGSILAPLMQAPPQDGEPFRLGVARAAEGGGLGRLLFSARSAVLARRFSEADAGAYLWGLLIGADVRENLAFAATRRLPCFVTGAPEVAPLFVAAIEQLGLAAELLDDRRLSAAGFSTLRRIHAEQEVGA
ncbi:2-dehydro-3-deoxygalactonokinase [Sphingomonas cannabina]|uniref:2-dehydro-3-deoxygalactonokinase n=1 Tax=Sphingomonas cannabina TaxID=2899123 RepID=UPI001F3FBD9A|nr:2-dehydro-3-deoxygalactonokinase [Sphingomonas cannabina]UIJ46483.1 2-dehydro-3-deoxygalactonokinase [Sphingomonas cannabina]